MPVDGTECLTHVASCNLAYLSSRYLTTSLLYYGMQIITWLQYQEVWRLTDSLAFHVVGGLCTLAEMMNCKHFAS